MQEALKSNAVDSSSSSDALPPNLQSSESLSIIPGEEEEEQESNEITASAENKKASLKPSVSFSTVRIHHHRLSLGDNPGVSSGIPLTLAWEYEQSETLKLDDVEHEKEESHHNNNHVRRITRTHREEIAAERHSRDSIVLAQEQVRELQRSREDSERDPLSCREAHQIKKNQAKRTNGEGFSGFLFGKGKKL